MMSAHFQEYFKGALFNFTPFLPFMTFPYAHDYLFGMAFCCKRTAKACVHTQYRISTLRELGFVIYRCQNKNQNNNNKQQQNKKN